MGKKTLPLLCTLLIVIILTRAGTADAQVSTLAVDPPTKTVDNPGLLFTVDIKITNAPTMMQYIITNIMWDPNIIELETGTESDVVKGPFLGGDVFLVTIGLPGFIDEVTEAKLSGTTSGSGTLFTIKFRSKAMGTTNITIEYGSRLLNGLTIADFPNRNNGTVTVVPEFPASMLLPLFLTATAITFIAATVLRKRRSYIKVP